MLMTAPVELSQELRDQIRREVERLREVVDRIEELLINDPERTNDDA